MKTLAIALLLGLIAPPVVQAKTRVVRSPGITEQLDAAGQAYRNAWRRGDADAVTAFYADDAVYIGTGGDVVTGRATILIGLRREVPAFRDFTAVREEWQVAAGVAWERGHYAATITLANRAPQPVQGPYLMIYERQANGPWKIRVHMTGRVR